MFIPNSRQYTTASAFTANRLTAISVTTGVPKVGSIIGNPQPKSAISHDRCTFTGSSAPVDKEETQPDFSNPTVRENIRQKLQEDIEGLRRFKQVLKQMDLDYPGRKSNLIEAYQEWWNTRPGKLKVDKQDIAPEQPVPIVTTAIVQSGERDFSTDQAQALFFIEVGPEAAAQIRESADSIRQKNRRLTKTEARGQACQAFWLKQQKAKEQKEQDLSKFDEVLARIKQAREGLINSQSAKARRTLTSVEVDYPMQKPVAKPEEQQQVIQQTEPTGLMGKFYYTPRRDGRAITFPFGPDSHAH